MFFAVLAHEELLQLEAAGVPPGDANEKSVGARAAGEAGGFCVEEKPLLGIGGAFRRIRSEQTQGIGGKCTFGRLGKPATESEMFAVTIRFHSGAENFGE